MAKTIDLSQKLDNTRPLIKVAEGKIYEVDNRKNTVLKLDKVLGAAGSGDLKAIEDVITAFLGKEACDEIEEMELSIIDYTKIIVAIMALINDEDYDSADARFQKEKERWLENQMV